ncbi:MAG: hypothetical protein IT462_01880 [Planctomycetes bacterium]|nr:hypothetical protein [Planctomycetota bacterium]
MDPTQLALMAAGLVAIMASLVLPRLVHRLAGRRKAIGARSSVPAAAPVNEAQLTAARELVVEIDDLSTRALARLDSKIRVLNKLIAEADEKIAKLEREKLLATNTHE